MIGEESGHMTDRTGKKKTKNKATIQSPMRTGVINVHRPLRTNAGNQRSVKENEGNWM